VRYKQTLMGVAWVIVQPLLSMLLFTVLFNRFAGVKSGSSMPYPLFAYTGLLLWTFLSNAVTNSTNSLINNANLITKVFFPRMFIPAAAVGAGLVDLGVASVILIGMAFHFGAHPGWSLWLLPVFVLMTAALALAVGLLISALTVKYRDLRHALPFLIQGWMFTSPVIYPVSMVPERWRWILMANPFTPVVEGFRAALISGPVDWRAVGISALMITVLLMLSVYIFRRIEDTFADLI
jgi:lipopolysaccharide transport system permease protein